jgi:tetratricopeptide (TPR) repeat protein
MALAMMISIAATAAWADPPAAEGPVLRAPGSLPPITDLIRAGLNRQAHGDLDGADASWSEIRRHYPDHPAGPVFEMHTLQLRNSLDWQGAKYHVAIRKRSKEALTHAEDWLERAPDDPQAHFYAGQIKKELMILDGLSGSYFKAGSGGEQARKHLERALELDPELIDAKLPLGLYYYYASIATRFIKWFTWLWFIPTGNHDLALEYIEDVSKRGDLFKVDSALELSKFYLYFEQKPEAARPILLSLHEAYPDNSYVSFELIELWIYLKDYDRAIQAALELEASRGSQFGDSTRRIMAKIFRARAELMRGNTEESAAILRIVQSGWVELSPWAKRWLLLTRGNLDDLKGSRDKAVAHYEEVLEHRSRWDSARSVELADAGLEAPFTLDMQFIGAQP